jgi:hypothetical protein
MIKLHYPIILLTGILCVGMHNNSFATKSQQEIQEETKIRHEEKEQKNLAKTAKAREYTAIVQLTYIPTTIDVDLDDLLQLLKSNVKTEDKNTIIKKSLEAKLKKGSIIIFNNNIAYEIFAPNHPANPDIKTYGNLIEHASKVDKNNQEIYKAFKVLSPSKIMTTLKLDGRPQEGEIIDLDAMEQALPLLTKEKSIATLGDLLEKTFLRPLAQHENVAIKFDGEYYATDTKEIEAYPTLDLFCTNKLNQNERNNLCNTWNSIKTGLITCMHNKDVYDYLSTNKEIKEHYDWLITMLTSTNKEEGSWLSKVYATTKGFVSSTASKIKKTAKETTTAVTDFFKK